MGWEPLIYTYCTVVCSMFFVSYFSIHFSYSIYTLYISLTFGLFFFGSGSSIKWAQVVILCDIHIEVNLVQNLLTIIINNTTFIVNGKCNICREGSHRKSLHNPVTHKNVTFFGLKSETQ